MIVLKIIGIVLLILLIVVALILMCPVGIIIKNDEEKGICLFLKILFIKIPIDTEQNEAPKKKATEYKHAPKKPVKKSNGFLQNILDAFGITKLTNVKKDVEDQGVTDTIGDSVSVVINIIKQIVALFKHIKVKKLFVNCICGGEDAAKIAMDYGIACAAIYPISGYLHSIIKFNSRKEQINVYCDFNREDILFEFETLLSVRVVFIVAALVKLVMSESERKTQEMK